MPAIVPNRPPCKRCGTPLGGIRCSSCGRFNLFRYLVRTWGARW